MRFRRDLILAQANADKLKGLEDMKAFLIHIASQKKLRVKREFVVGRMDGTKTYPDDGRMSRTHCILRFQNDVLTVEDLGSKNGTQIAGMNIEARKPIELVNGDLLTIGDQKFEVLFKGKPKDVPVAKKVEADLSETLPREPVAASGPALSVTAPTNLEGTGANSSEYSRTAVVEPLPEKTVADGYTNATLKLRATSSPGLHEVDAGEEASDVNVDSHSQSQSSYDPRDEFVNHPSLPKPDHERFNSDQMLVKTAKPADKKKGKNAILHEASLDPLNFKQEVENLKATTKENLVARDFDAESGASHEIGNFKDEEVKKGLSSLLRSLKKGIKKEDKSERTAETSRINVPAPSRSSPKSEEVIFARMEKPSIVKTLLLLAFFIVAGPIVVLEDPAKMRLLQGLPSLLERVLWGAAFVVPALLVGIPVQVLRMRAGWTSGMRSIFLTGIATGAVILVQMICVEQLEKRTGFDRIYFTDRVRKLCVDAYKPEACATLVFQCPDCLKQLSFRDRREFLESIYPTVEVLAQNGETEAGPRVPASNGAATPQAKAPAKPAKAPPKVAVKKPVPPPPPTPAGDASAPNSYPEPNIIPDKQIE